MQLIYVQNIVTMTPDAAGTEWPVPNRALAQQDRTLRSSRPSVYYQLKEAPILRQPSESLSNSSVRSSQDSQHIEPDNLVLENNVFLLQELEPDLQLPPITPKMAEERTLLSDPFVGTPKEDAAEFWRRLETYLEYKRSDEGDKLRLAMAMFVLTARDWLENLPQDRKDTYMHVKTAFAEKFIKPAILKWQSANDIFTKQQMPTETVDEYANRIRNLGKRI